MAESGSDPTAPPKPPRKPMLQDEVSTDDDVLAEPYTGRSYVKTERRIMLIGKTGSGKSATANTFLGREEFKSIPGNESVTTRCEFAEVEIANRSVLLVDTPGMFDTCGSNEEISKEIMKCAALASPGIHAVILVIRIGRYTEEEKKTVELFKENFGDELTKYMMVICTGKDDLEHGGITQEAYMEKCSPSFKGLISECGGRIHFLNNRSSEEQKDTFRRELVDAIDTMVEENGGRCYTTQILEEAEAIMKERENALKKEIAKGHRPQMEKIQQRLEKIFNKDNPQLVKMTTVNKGNAKDVAQKTLEVLEKKYMELKRKFEKVKDEKDKQLREKEDELKKLKVDNEQRLETERQKLREEKLKVEEAKRLKKDIDEMEMKDEEEARFQARKEIVEETGFFRRWWDKVKNKFTRVTKK